MSARLKIIVVLDPQVSSSLFQLAKCGNFFFFFFGYSFVECGDDFRKTRLKTVGSGRGKVSSKDGEIGRGKGNGKGGNGPKNSVTHSFTLKCHS
ncbi:hypothetical protein FEM48_Zijuj10G0159700 [Ziziphus jujuba var. spinosa]|uniref:Uncharacterized protein n=1 Tax=Ziziphus jujuba var. spinosa TaxID=714518 RepID=A0A978UPB7_ZIZJJ|nr:hypothetical protein FEM48_Zijuj10G0159700 [Ziziphus jujuba var. spinosa]